MTTKIVEEIAKYKNIGSTVEQIDTTKIITLDNFISTETITTEDKLKKQGITVINYSYLQMILNIKCQT